MGPGRRGALTSPLPPAAFPAALPVGPVAPRRAHALERDPGGGPPGTVADVLTALAEALARPAGRLFVPLGAAVVALPPVRAVEVDGQDHPPPLSSRCETVVLARSLEQPVLAPRHRRGRDPVAGWSWAGAAGVPGDGDKATVSATAPIYGECSDRRMAESFPTTPDRSESDG